MRRSVLFAAACIVIALHPTFIASALLEGNVDISAGLEWIRTWALEVAESDIDRECYMVRKGNLKPFLPVISDCARVYNGCPFCSAIPSTFPPFFLVLNLLTSSVNFLMTKSFVLFYLIIIFFWVN